MKTIQKLLAFMLVFISTYAYSQNYTIKGSVQDAEKTPLIGATVVVLNPVDSVMIGFGITDNDGRFSVSSVKSGDYNLQITYIGYGTFQNSISVQGEEKQINLGVINLLNDTQMLDEVEIKAEFIPLVVKKDTVEYNADAYRVRPNANVEELLKKLPGIEVDSDGSITAEGEEVKKVTVDGKQFFGNDTKAATQNLPASAIKKVQVYDEKSKKSEFTGVSDDADTKTINLELKEDKKRGYFGNVKAGYGTSDRLDTKLNINSFAPKMQLSGIIGYNNINKNGFSFSDYQDLVGNSGFGYGRFSTPLNLNFGDRANGDSKNLNAGLNFNYDLGGKSRVKASYYLINTDNKIRKSNYTEYRLADRPFTNQDTINTDSKSQTHVVNAGIELEKKDVHRLEFEVRMNIDNESSIRDNLAGIYQLNGDVASLTKNIQNNENTKLSYDATLDYNLKLGKKGRVFSTEASYGTYDLDDSLDVVQMLEAPVEQRLLNQYQLDTTTNNSFKVELSYQEPLAKDQYLEAIYTRKNYSVERIKDFLDKNPFERDYDLSRATDNTTNYDDYELNYKFDKSFLFAKIGLTYHRSYIGGDAFNFDKNNDALVKDETSSLTTKTFDAVLPHVSLRLFDKSLRFRYKTSLDEPSVSELQTIVDNTNPNRVQLGNPFLKPEYEHSLSLRYHKFDRFTFRNIFSSLSYAYTANNIIDSISISDRFVQTRKPINGDGAHSVNGYLSMGTPIKPLFVKTRLSLSGTWRMANNYVGEQLDKFQFISPSVSIEFENLNNDFVTAVVRSRTQWNNNYYDINNNLNSKFLTQTFSGELIADLGKGFSFDTEIDYNQYFSNGERYNSFALWNATVSKSLLDDKLVLSLTAYDILNQNTGVNVYQNSTSVSRQVSNTLQRYVMFSVSYKFSSLGAVPENPNKVIIMKH